MTEDPIPQSVINLIQAHLPSMEHVEVLLAMHAAVEQQSLAAVAGMSRLDEQTAERTLDALVAAGLVLRTDAGYRPSPAAIASAEIRHLRSLYNTRPVTLVRAIYSRPSPLQSFSDAFRIRKRREDTSP